MKQMKKQMIFFITVLLATLITTTFAGCAACNESATGPVTPTPIITTTITPTPTEEAAPAFTPTVEVIPTETSDATPTESLSITATPELTEIPTPTKEAAPAPTEEVLPTDAPVMTEEPVPTEAVVAPTEAPTSTVAPTSTPEPTNTPIPTSTPVPTATPTPKPTATPKPTPTPTPVPVKGIVAGDYVTFGSYPQNLIKEEDLTEDIVNAEYDKYGIAVINGERYFSGITEYTFGLPAEYSLRDPFRIYSKLEPVEWLVLEVKDGKAFLLAKDSLDAEKFDENYDIQQRRNENFGGEHYDYHPTWESCTLRTWLNSEFYNLAFTKKDKESVLLTEVKNTPNMYRGDDSGPDTMDYVYLLSDAEAIKYFGEEWLRTCFVWDPPAKTEQLCTPTEVAFARGGYTELFSYGEVVAWHDPYSHWWLRTTGGFEDGPVYMYSNGFLMADGTYGDRAYIGVRPCLWIDVETADVEKVK
ncbi:MAG: DUF6273 domain-containing protein [Lachnospiraceae bacterium]|nr:DUF6273 domain-containing protein [Lachnospiraceae bacterium]